MDGLFGASCRVRIAGNAGGEAAVVLQMHRQGQACEELLEELLAGLLEALDLVEMGLPRRWQEFSVCGEPFWFAGQSDNVLAALIAGLVADAIFARRPLLLLTAGHGEEFACYVGHSFHLSARNSMVRQQRPSD